jgi:hypothetical protein
MIQTIETHYRGYRFRSRLEARWAVYFDTIGLHWQYEREGYRLTNPFKGPWLRHPESISYFPDFWLPQVSRFAEVKPFPFEGLEFYKAALLACQTRFPVLMLVGRPEAKPYEFIEIHDEGDVSRHYTGPGPERGVLGPGYHCLFRMDCVVSMYRKYPVKEDRFYTNTAGLLKPQDFEKGGRFEDVTRGVRASRSARFEPPPPL